MGEDKRNLPVDEGSEGRGMTNDQKDIIFMEMLEALTLVKTMIDNHAKHWRNGSGYQKICVAIKKARGEE